MATNRTDLLHQILDQSTGAARIDDLSGVLGTGKTYLLGELDSATRAHGVHPVLVRLEDFDPGHHGEAGAGASVGAVQGSFHAFVRLLQKVLDDLCPADVASDFARQVTDAYNAEVVGRRVFSLEHSVDELTATLSPESLADAWRDAARAVATSFEDRWTALADQAPRVLLLDNADVVADQEIGAFLGDLLPRLRNTVVVATREPHGVPLPVPMSGQALQSYEIGNLDLEEVRAFLAAKVAGGRVPDPVVRTVYAITGGHPATLAIVFALVWGGGGSRSVDPQDLLGLAREQPGERVAQLLQLLVEAGDDPLLGPALQAAAVARSLSSALLRHLLADSGATDEDAIRLYLALEKLPLVEKPWGDKGSLRLHSLVRESVLARMARLDRSRLLALHARAAAYYHGLLVGEGGNDIAVTYGEAFVYEDPQWQGRKREWLYHSGFASGGDRHNTLVEFAVVFLHAEWWWGNYVHFDFCDQLLADLGQLARQHGGGPASPHRPVSVDPEDRAWPALQALHDALRRILQGYPLRSMKPTDADWPAVRTALLQVQRACGLDKDRGRTRTRREQHLSALLNVFLAHTWRYQGGHVEKADRYYARAAELFAGTDEWSPGWVAYERADLRLENGDVEPVPHLWRTAAHLAQPRTGPSTDPDEELVSNLHRLRADCAWLTGDRERAADEYGRAVLHAYLFHFAGEIPPWRQDLEEAAPDLYTLQFYVDIRARAINRLREAWAAGDRRAAVTCAGRMAAVVAAAFGEEPGIVDAELEVLLADGRPLPLALRLFPRGPSVADLETASEFLEHFLNAREELDLDSLAVDLHDGTWP